MMEDQGKYHSTDNEEIITDRNFSSSYSDSTEAEQKSISAMEYRYKLLAAFVFLLGIGVSAAFLVFGLNGAEDDSTNFFNKRSSELVQVVEGSWRDYGE